MKLQSKLLILNTTIILVCLMMLLMVVGIVTNIFRTQYIEGLTIKDFEIRYADEVPNPPAPKFNPEQAMKITNQAATNFYMALVVSALISIVVIVFISQIFTRKVSNKIMKPINKLMEANKRVENGNYEQIIEYDGEYEFKELCKSFNNMQKSLKYEKELNAKEQKVREDMIHGISHDLRTPLTSIKGYIKGLKDGVADTKEKQEKYLEVAYSKACEMGRLIDKLFSISKLEEGEILYDIKMENIGDVINEYVNEQKIALNEKGIELICNIETNEEVMIDKEQINRVFNNIIYNSIKYADVENLIVEINVQKQNDNIEIKIKDNGKGIEKHKLERIFEEFYRCDESRTNSNKEGNGLGLYICKKIIEKHKGNIFAESNNGLQINIILPIGGDKV